MASLSRTITRASFLETAARARLSERQFAWAAVLFFSIAYFTQTLIRASEKRFWFDELCSYYICRLPTLHDSWTAVLHGADFNPPLYYVIQRAGAALFGFGLIGFRLPQILAFWILCVCLFLVVRRVAGDLCGFAAMAVPLLTGAYYYAYEARPHGLVLGCAGLALLCWSALLDRPRSMPWLLAFAVCLQAAFLIHCYAVLIAGPFALVELVRNVRAGRLNTRFWLALILPVLIAARVFRPLLHSFRENLGSTTFLSTFSPAPARFAEFYYSLFQPLTVVLLVLLVYFAAEYIRPSRRMTERDGWAGSEAWPLLLLAVGFLGMPLYGIVLARIVHGPFFARYFTSAAIGVAVALSFSLSRRRGARAVIGLIALLIAFDALLVVWHRAHGWGEKLNEPSTNYWIDSVPHDALESYTMLTHTPAHLTVAIPSLLNYLYLLHYWPAARRRMFYIVPSLRSAAYLSNRGLFEFCRLPGHDGLPFDDFMRQHPDFVIFSSQIEDRSLPGELVSHGAEIRSFVFDGRGNYLAHLIYKGAPAR